MHKVSLLKIKTAANENIQTLSGYADAEELNKQENFNANANCWKTAVGIPIFNNDKCSSLTTDRCRIITNLQSVT